MSIRNTLTKSLPKIKTPSLKMPSMKTPSLKMPSMKTPSLKMPSMKMPSMKMPSMKTPSLKMPSMKMPSMKTPSLKMPSMKTPSMTPAAQEDTGNIIKNILNTIVKNIVIILIFMLLIFAIYIVGQLININKDGETKPIYDEKKMVLKIDKNEDVSADDVQKMIDEYELKNKGQAGKNKKKWLSSFFNIKNHFKKGGEENEEKSTEEEEEKVIEGHGAHNKLKRHTGRINEYCLGGCSEHKILDDGSKVCKSYRDDDGAATDKYNVGSACCSDIKKVIFASGSKHWQFDWGINANWQKKHKNWYCHCELGVPTDKECCQSWITGVLVKPDHPDSTCLPGNKGKKGDGWGNWPFGDAAKLLAASKCFAKGGHYNKNTGKCEGGGWSWPDCSFKSADVCRKKRYGFVEKDNDYKYCHFGKCVCPSGRFGDSCQYSTDGGKLVGNNDPEDYNDHDPYSKNDGNHPRDKDLSDKNIGIVDSTEGEVVAKPYKPKNRPGLKEGFIENYRGVDFENCDASFNSTREKISCKNWWNKLCNDGDPAYCSERTPLGQDKCLQYPCCLWELKDHKKSPQWKDSSRKDRYNQDIAESSLINRTDKTKPVWQNNEKNPLVWFGGGRCVKGTPDGGPHDKNQHMNAVSNYLNEENSKNVEDRDGEIKRKEDEILALRIDEDRDEFVKFWRPKGDADPENELTKNDFEIHEEERDKVLSGILNKADYKTLDEFYYTEYKHREKGGTTTFHRFLDGNAITLYPNKDGELKDADGNDLLEQAPYKFSEELE